jgi:pyrroloquinoline quinone biosynthesis protein B
VGRLKAIVLGSAAGGGFPQWNDRGPVGRLAWDGDPRAVARTQASLAVSADGERWLLLNASPDIRAQVLATPALHPRTAPRHSPVTDIVLTGGEVDQVAGLLSLRERQPFTIWATAPVLDELAANPIFEVLSPEYVTRRAVAVGQAFEAAGLTVELFPVPGKVPLYREDAGGREGTIDINVGAEIRAGGATLSYIPGCASLTSDVLERLRRADVVLFDGTLFMDDEMIRSQTGSKTGRRMGHMPVSGDGGSLDALPGIRARKIYTHINNTNPLLIEGSSERQRVETAGWDVAYDGMEIAL